MNYTHITFIMDRSGSMNSIKDDAIGGINNLVETQRLEAGKCTMSFIQFDDIYEEVYSFVPIADVPLRNNQNYTPRGGTALLDAIGRGLATTKEQLAGMPDEERPGVVMIAILTDGHENQSKEYTRSQIRELIESVSKELDWKVSYLGATLDAMNVAADLGVNPAMAARFAAESSNAQAAYGSHSNMVTRARKAGAAGQSITPESIGYTTGERGLMVENPKKK